MKNNLNQRSSSQWVIALGFAALTASGCAGGPLTTREKGAGIGAVGGAAAGGLIGAAAVQDWAPLSVVVSDSARARSLEITCRARKKASISTTSSRFSKISAS